MKEQEKRSRYIKLIRMIILSVSASVILAGCADSEKKPEDVNTEISSESTASAAAEADAEAFAVVIQDSEPVSESTGETIDDKTAATEAIESENQSENPRAEKIPAEELSPEKLTEPDDEPETNIKGYTESEREKEIYSYVQVPYEYYPDETWVGDWTDIESGGQKFFYFGCGVCCLSNMYSTFAKEATPPDVMFEMAKEYSDYNPDSGTGALSWNQLKTLSDHLGIDAVVKKKPDNYEEFQNDVKNADTTLVLVCKYNDDKLWFYTLGHYVNLWEYDEDSDTVFVTDASGMFNRDRVNLRDVYNALKTSSSAQYMCCTVR